MIVKSVKTAGAEGIARSYAALDFFGGDFKGGHLYKFAACGIQQKAYRLAVYDNLIFNTGFNRLFHSQADVLTVKISRIIIGIQAPYITALYFINYYVITVGQGRGYGLAVIGRVVAYNVNRGFNSALLYLFKKTGHYGAVFGVGRIKLI